MIWLLSHSPYFVFFLGIKHNETAFEEGHSISSLAYSSAAAEFLTASGSDLKVIKPVIEI